MLSEATPEAVSEAIQKLETGDQVAIHTYIAQLKATIADLEVQVAGVTSPAVTRDEDEENENENDDEPMMADVDATMSEEEEVPVATTTANASSVEAEISEPPAPPQYDEATGAEDFDAAGDLKQEAAELKQNKAWGPALEKYTAAILAAPPSALLLANRAFVLLELDRPRAAIADCNVALSHNPDSAKALRIRGTAYKRLGQYEQARLDLSGSQAIDYDDVAAQDLKFVSQQVLLVEAEQAQKKLAEQTVLQEKLERQRQAEAKERAEQREREVAEREARTAASRGSMPGGGGMGMPPGGMGGMGGLMSVLMSDPELKAGLSNPKVMAALSGLMSGPGGPMGLMQNPAKLQELMADPDVGPFLQKVMAKLGGGGMGGMPGMPGMGDMGMPPGGGMNDDDMPDLDDIPNLD